MDLAFGPRKIAVPDTWCVAPGWYRALGPQNTEQKTFDKG